MNGKEDMARPSADRRPGMAGGSVRPDSEPGSGHSDPRHDWRRTRVMRVPTGFPRYMQFQVELLECGRCGGQMTTLNPATLDEETYQTPRCGDEETVQE